MPIATHNVHTITVTPPPSPPCWNGVRRGRSSCRPPRRSQRVLQHWLGSEQRLLHAPPEAGTPRSIPREPRSCGGAARAGNGRRWRPRGGSRRAGRLLGPRAEQPILIREDAPLLGELALAAGDFL